MSNSGGSFGPDGWLYVTGHDASAAYLIKIPEAGSVLIWVGTVELPDIAGQGIAWVREVKASHASLWGISRESRQLVGMKVPLQECVWAVDGPTNVGSVLGPEGFVDMSQD